MLVLDGLGVRRLADRTPRSLAVLDALLARGMWPAVVPSIVLVDCLSGDRDTDAAIERFLRTCDVRTDVPAAVARRAAWLRTAAGRGSAADAIVVATAEPQGAVLTAGRRVDIEALALFAEQVYVERA